MITACLLAACLQAGAADAGADALAALAAKSARCDQGLCLVLGDADGRLVAALAKASRLQVQGVSADRETAERLRRALEKTDVAERTSAVWRRTPHLPYLDNLINLAVVNGWGGGESKDLALAEVVRVLCPGGVAIVGSDAGGDAAALAAEAGKCALAKVEKLDRPGAWIRIVKQMDPAYDEWAQYTEEVNNDKAVAPCREVRWVGGPLWDGGSAIYGNEIVAGGRTFHAEYIWQTPFKRQATLVARDAFNGTVLWREKVNAVAGTNYRTMLCADGERVYYKDDKNLIGRDATTGAVFRDYGPIGYLKASVRDRLITESLIIDKASGKVVGKVPSTNHLAATDEAVCVMTKDFEVLAYSCKDGANLWKTPTLEPSGGAQWPTLVGSADAVYVLAKNVVALDARTGKVRWIYSGKRERQPFLPFTDQVWMGGEGGALFVLDAQTGKEIRSGVKPVSSSGGCWQPRGTAKYLVYGRSGFVDRATFATGVHHGIRGSCKVGEIPAYGMIYYGPHNCHCRVSLRGVVALSPGSALPKAPPLTQLVPGTSSAAASGPGAAAADWPVYRSSGARGNASAAELPAGLRKLWSAKLGTGALPQATGAGSTVFAVEPEAHRLVALDLASGKEKWSFVAEGRLSMAPTYHNGLCLLGDNAGWVYCLDAASGRLAWQFQAAPAQQYMCAYGQLESSWPVKSGVLVFDGAAWFAAGRGSTMDGGITLYSVDLASGQKKTSQNFDSSGTMANARTADLLLSDGARLLGWGGVLATSADKAAAKGPCFQYDGGYPGPLAILDMLGSLEPARDKRKVPSDGRLSGDLIAFDKDRTVASSRAYSVTVSYKPGDREAGRCRLACKGTANWERKDFALDAQALLLAGERVYCAGIPEFRDNEDKPELRIISAADGKDVQKLPLESAPAIDGLSAVGGRLIVTTADGQVVCFGGQ
ncbi:MAG TPA: PQQ-binding-like beta-propeller repeat protein [Planctomycetota bacterium]|nr:PQQ-binding-like beta-propeller repeat protein [Planctomycetota bacterium]